MHKFFSVLVLLLMALFFKAGSVAAQTPDPYFMVGEAPTNVYENQNSVVVTFNDVQNYGHNPETVYICTRGDACLSGDAGDSPEKRIERLGRAGAGNFGAVLPAAFSGTLAQSGPGLSLCGDGENNLKLDRDGNRCNYSRAYFFPGRTYYVTLYALQASKFVAVGMASFYVKHVPPSVEVTSNTDWLPAAGDPTSPGGFIYPNITAIITRDWAFPEKNQNNFQLILEGPNYKNERCISFGTSPGSQTVTWPQASVDEATRLLAGTYKIKVNEQINEKLPWDKCSGGYTYVEITCSINNQTDPARRGCKPPVHDPNSSELTDDDDLFNQAEQDNIPHPCRPNASTGVDGYSDLTRCLLFGTAIGPIGVHPANFISRIFSILLYIAGLAAVGLIIVSGYRLLTSRGNKEVIQASRETLTSAIIGIIFIILSLVILQLITVNILRIPGFT